MRIAYLIDRDSLGGGMEYVRRQIAQHAPDVCCTLFSTRGECRIARIDAWGADEIVVNHLKALLQLMRCPWKRPRGCVRFVVHGIHLRKYDWMLRETQSVVARMLLWIKREMRRRLERWLYHRCDEIVALTETDRRDILSLYGSDLNVHVEPNTLDGWSACLEGALPDGIQGPFKYLCIGRFDYQKGQDRLVRFLARQNDDSRVLFIGDGESLVSCKVLAEELGLAGRCVFAGAIPNADRYLKCTDVVVSPSRWEGMPYLMMKARVLGCKILATDCPGNRDVLAGYDGWTPCDFA